MTRPELYDVLLQTIDDVLLMASSFERKTLAESIMDILVEPGVSLVEKVTK